MALDDLTFKLYNDSALTDAFTGTLPVTHFTDLSDNPQDFTLYFGSTEAARQLEATSNPGVDQISLTPTNGLPAWAATTAYSVGDAVEPTTPNGYRYVCTTAGTSGGSEPTWPTTGIGSTIVDGTVVWTFVGARHELTEIKLALTEVGLGSAVAGAALDLGTTLTSGVGNAVEFWIRVTNAVTTVGDNSGQPGILININEVEETE
jgi:hypothetical protein